MVKRACAARRMLPAWLYCVLAVLVSVAVWDYGGESNAILRLDSETVSFVLMVAAAAAAPFFALGLKEVFARLLSRGLRLRVLISDLLLLALYSTIFLLLLHLSYTANPWIWAGGRSGEEAGSQVARHVERETTPSSAGASEVIREEVPQPLVPRRLVGAAYLAVILSCTLSGALAFLLALRERRPTPREDGMRMPEAHARILEASREAVAALAEGSSPREVVVAYFLRLCEILRSLGLQVAEHLTAREVAELAAERLGLEREPLYRLVTLFEEARYSEHPVTEDARREALQCLTAIEEHLRG
ncbi:MAG: hypothetical protein DRJ96_04345 [Thermoprotei archaeon]|nr:MAG: hypothetical protein DRJ96_04330 [Thermoprotei archaeon]RLE97270.1 MAG: hypothetical protein DRJ96_04345 [Thermoprotei archaeon]